MKADSKRKADIKTEIKTVVNKIEIGTMEAYGKTNVGKVRLNNEDSFFLTLEKINFLDNLFIVADGMGGHSAGEVASQEAIKRLIEFILGRDVIGKDYKTFLKKATEHANYQTYIKSVRDKGLKGMGTTMTVITIVDRMGFCTHVGDSRLYLYREGELKQQSVDHTFIQEIVQSGKLTEEEARVHPNRNMITRAVGIGANVAVDSFELYLQKDDIIMLCSDGLTGMIPDEMILETLNAEDTIENKTEKLIQQALDNGGEDNITVILVKVL